MPDVFLYPLQVFSAKDVILRDPTVATPTTYPVSLGVASAAPTATLAKSVGVTRAYPTAPANANETYMFMWGSSADGTSDQGSGGDPGGGSSWNVVKGNAARAVMGVSTGESLHSATDLPIRYQDYQFFGAAPTNSYGYYFAIGSAASVGVNTTGAQSNPPNSSGTSSSATTSGYTLPSTPTIGDLVLVFVSVRGGVTASTPTDSSGEAYTLVFSGTTAGSVTNYLWSRVAAANDGAFVVTSALSGSAEWSLYTMILDTPSSTNIYKMYEGAFVSGAPAIRNTLTATTHGAATPLATAAFTKSAGVIKAISSTTTAALANSFSPLITRTATGTAALAKVANLTKPTTANVTTTVLKSVGKLIAATSTETAAFSLNVIRALTFAATANSTAAALKSVGLVKAATSTTTATLTKSIAKTFQSTNNPLLTTVIDSFNTGANQGWDNRWTSSHLWTGATFLTTDSVPTYAKGASSLNDGLYPTLLGRDTDASIILASAIDTGVAVYSRITAFGSPTAYAVEVTSAGVWTLIKIITGTKTTLAGPITRPVVSGDGIGIRASGTAISAWRKLGSDPWQEVLSVTDTSITNASASRIGVTTADAVTRLDSFNGSATPAIASFAKSVGLIKLATSTGTAALTKSVGKLIAITSTETPTFSKAVTRALSFATTATTSATALKSVGLVKAATSTGTATMLKSVGKLVAQTSTGTAVLTKTVNLTKAVTSTCTATVNKSPGLVRAASSTATASFSKIVGSTRAATSTGTAVFTDTLTRALTLAATATTTATFTKIVGLVKLTTSTVTPTTSKTVGLVRAAISTGTATFVQTVGSLRATTSTVTAALTKGVNVTRSTTSTVTATAIKSVGKTFLATASAVADFSGEFVPKVTSTALTFAVTAVVTASYIQTVGNTLANTVAGSPTFSKIVGAPRAATSTVTPSFIKSMLSNLAATATATPTYLKSLAKTLALTITTSPAVSKIVNVSKTTSSTITPSAIKSVLINSVTDTVVTPTLTRVRTVAIMAVCVSSVTANFFYITHQQFALLFAATANVTASMFKEVDLYFADTVRVLVRRGRTLFGYGQ